MAGILLWLNERLKRWGRDCSPRRPRILKGCMMRPSGPAARELPLILIACETISGKQLDNEL